MKKQDIIWFMLGMGLLASMSSCTGNDGMVDNPRGYTHSEVRSIQHLKDIDSCLDVAITYTRAADILDPLVDVPNSNSQLRAIQVQYLDSAAKYKKVADLLVLKP